MGPRGEQGPAGPQGPRVSTILVLVFFRWYLLVMYDVPIQAVVLFITLNKTHTKSLTIEMKAIVQYLRGIGDPRFLNF